MIEAAGFALQERERELSRLADAIGRAADGDAGLIAIEGEPGLGKTALLDCAAAFARAQGLQVLRARGGVLERAHQWGVARQLFEQLVVRAKGGERRRLLHGEAAAAAPLLWPAKADPGLASEASFEHGLYWLVSNLADRAPVALLIDDARWCDDASLRWLLYLVRRMERLRVAVAITLPTCEPDDPRGLVEAIRAEPRSESIAPAPLSAAGTHALLERVYGASVEHEFSGACHEWTGGNPLFAAQLADELLAAGVRPVSDAAYRVREQRPPRSISRRVLLRIARLGAAAIALLRAAAVLEPACELRHAAELAGLGEAEAVDAFDELVEARVLLADQDRPLQFDHPLVAAVVYDDLPPARRAAAHARAARLLDAAGADSDQVAAQLLRAAPGGEEWVVDRLLHAAHRALQRGLPRAAVELLTRASAEPPTPEMNGAVLLARGRAELLSGDPTARETLRAARQARLDDRGRTEIALLAATFELRAGAPADAVALLQEQVERVDLEFRAKFEAQLIVAARLAGDLELVAQREAVLWGRTGSDSYGAGSAALAWGRAAAAAPAAETIELARAALAGGLIEQAPAAPEVWLGAIHALEVCDQLDEADTWCAEAIVSAERCGAIAAHAAAGCQRAIVATSAGRLYEGEQLAREALRLAPESCRSIRDQAEARLVLALVDRGELDAARAVPSRDRGDAVEPPEWLFAVGRLEVATGTYAAGVELLTRCGELARGLGIVNPAWLPWRSEAALALLHVGEASEARRLGEEELELARRSGVPRAIGVALRVAGVLAGGNAGVGALGESVRVLAASGARLELARSLVELGCSLRRNNRRAAARAPLHEGLALAERFGAVPLAQRARAELAAAGSRPRLAFRAGADALTASERRVCELAASGKSNPEIAQSLFVTRATVESHLHSAYRKLDIARRDQLELALAA